MAAATTDFELSVSPHVGDQGVGPSLIDTLHQNHTFAIILLAAGVIILGIAIAIIIRNRRRVNFGGFSKNNNARFLLIAALLTLGGVGDMIYLNNVNAATVDLPFTTSGKIYADVKSKDDESTLYCGTDTITVKEGSDKGYTIFMKVGNRTSKENTLGKLISIKGNKEDIESTDDWDSSLPKNTWGFVIGPSAEKSEEYNPILLGEGSILIRKPEATSADDKFQVSFCANLSKDNMDTGDRYEAQIEYNIMFNKDPIDLIMDYLTTTDLDKDGLNNREENRYGTKIDAKDSDGDGLDDEKEVNTHKSNPLNEDSDGDGMLDFSESIAKTDMNNGDTNPGVKDLDVEYEYSYDLYEGDEEGKTLPTIVKGFGNFANAILNTIATAEIDEDTADQIGEKFTVAINETVRITNVAIDFVAAHLEEEEAAEKLQLLSVNQESEEYQYTMSVVQEGTSKFLQAAIQTASNVAKICLKAISLFRH